SSPGHLLQMMGDERLNMSGNSSGFALVSHPAFGIYTSSSGCSEFGGLGSLGLSALAPHSQFGTFPGKEAQGEGTAAFFPPLLGLHPAFASNFKGHDPVHLQSYTSGNKKGLTPKDNMHYSSLKLKASINGSMNSFLCPVVPFPRNLLSSLSLCNLQTRTGMKFIKKSASSSSLQTPPTYSSDILSINLLSLPHSNDTNLFLNQHPNGAMHSEVQDAPLALVTKPHCQSSTASTKPHLAATSPPCPLPVNLSSSTKELSGSSATSFKSSSSSGLVHISRETKTHKSLRAGKCLPKTNSSCASVDLVRGTESEIYSSKESDDSLGDEDEDDADDDIEDEDSGSKSESNLESSSDGSEDDIKQCGETRANSNVERTLKLAKSSAHESSSDLSANCSLLNLQIIKPPSLPSGSEDGKATNFTKHSSTDTSLIICLLLLSWQRETRIRTVAGRLQGEVAYFAPCGKKLRQYPDVMKGLQWFLLSEEEIAPSVIAMDGRHSRRTKSEHEMTGGSTGARQWKADPVNLAESNFQDVSDAKLLRKLEAQEIARQAAQLKLMRKLEKQAMVQAAKEARKQQAIMAAEERRKKREQIKILKQQEKIKRIQQIRMEKELRAQQILEAKRKKKEAAVNAKILEAEKRHKVSKIRFIRLFCHSEKYVSVLYQEKERRRQHMMLMKAVEARKKAEEKERLKKEKKNEKRLNKERKLELKRLELEKAKELKKPNEDMCLADHKPLPELSHIPGLVLPGSAFSDCLVVLQFLRTFGKVLGLDINSNMFTLRDLQAGLLNIGDSMGKVQDLLVSMLFAALRDPGIPSGRKSKTSLGDHLANVEMNRDNVSEILQIYMEGHCEQTELTALAISLRTKAFQAHSPSQKAYMLAFLVNELCSSKAVISEIDKNIDNMTNLRKDMWVVEGKLRKLRNIHAKRTGKRDSSVGLEDSHSFVIPTGRNKCKRKEGDSEEEEDEDDDSEDQGDEEEEEEEESGGKKGKKAEMCEDEDDGAHSASMEELEKQIEKTYKQQSQIRQKLFNSSHSLRSMAIGQDRYKRRYWVLPHCGGVFVEGMGSGEGYEEVENEKTRQRTAPVVNIKQEHLEETKIDTTTPKRQQDKDNLNLFLQTPGSLSKLSKLLEVAKIAQESDISSRNSHSAKAHTTVSYPSYPTSQKELSHSPQSATSQQRLPNKTDTSVSSLLNAPQFKSNPCIPCSPQSVLHDDQLSKILMEKSNQWFSLLPRSPCEGSVTSDSSPPAYSSSPQTISTKSPTSLSPNPLDTCIFFSLMKNRLNSAIHQSSLTLCDMSRAATGPSLPFPDTPLHSILDLASQHREGNGNRVLFLANNNSINKTTEAQNDKPLCVSFPDVEVAKTQDYPSPQPIPEEMLHGWWRVSDLEELQCLIKALHSRGVRERVLLKQIQKHMEYMTQLSASSKDEIDVEELEMQQVTVKTVESWCVEEQAMEVDISLLQQVEELERKVVSASLQVKGWTLPEPQSEREDLVYHENKLFSFPSLEKKDQKETSTEELPGTMSRLHNNPLDIAVTRLAELERNIDRRYLKKKSQPCRSDWIMPPHLSMNDTSHREEEVAPGLRWRKALSEVRSAAQLSLCIQHLQKSIAWERSIMKVHCQLCQKGDNEELLLLCDGCDKGCHTYCHKPKITTVPDGDWFCSTCVAKESGHFPQSWKQQSQTAGGGKKGSEVKRNNKPSVEGEEAASGNSVPKKGTKEFKKRKGDDSPASSQAKKYSEIEIIFALLFSRVLLAELEANQDAWPFLTPVNHKAVPGYRKVIKKPMDFSTIREKLTNNQYLNLEMFLFDVNLVFDNCEKFNEDNSEIGRAGHNMRRFFDKRWTELLN
uniref:Bromodomain adjacent to zinc finger domain 2B n=1 Tax=Mastacembelus armatus TaxID=205130 RepID=A0A7N8WZP9_9TELE